MLTYLTLSLIKQNIQCLIFMSINDSIKREKFCGFVMKSYDQDTPNITIQDKINKMYKNYVSYEFIAIYLQ